MLVRHGITFLQCFMTSPNLTATERLLLVNQYRILASLEPENGSASDYQNKVHILTRGYRGMYDQLFDELSEEHDESVTTEVHDILSMFRTIENSLAHLNDEQREQLDLSRLAFEGFDGNRDPHYGEAKFMIEKLEYYEEHQRSKLDAHSSAPLHRYRQQLALLQRVHQPMKELTFDQLKQLSEV